MDGVEQVVVLFQYTGLIHIGRVRDDVGLIQGNCDGTTVVSRCVVGRLRQVYADLDGAAVAVPEAVLGKGDVDDVEQRIVVFRLVHDRVLLRGAHKLVARHDAREHDRRAERVCLAIALLSGMEEARNAENARHKADDDAIDENLRLG